MKKIVFISLCMAFVIHIQAQDTIQYPMDCYMYKEKLPAYPVPIIPCALGIAEGIAQRYICSDSTTLYGFAITYVVKYFNTFNPPQMVSYDSIDFDIKPALYVPTVYDDSLHYAYNDNGQLVYLDSICDGGYISTVEQINTTSENILRKDLTFRYEHDLPSPGYTDVHCTEFYFDSPRRVKDTFYLALMKWADPDSRFSIHPVGAVGKGNVDTSQKNSYVIVNKETFDRSGLVTNVQCVDLWPPTSLIFSDTDTTSWWGAYFPIVKLRCTPVKGLSLMGQGKGWARIGWRRFVDEGINYDLELVKYKTGSGGDTVVLDDILLLSLTDTAHLFADLDLGGHYAYRVRKHCRYATTAYDTTVASEWTPRKYFDIDTYDWESVDNAPAADFGLSPNPAHGAATLALRQPADADARVEVTDALGRTVLVQALPAGADRVTLDLSRLSAGTYLVKVLTPRATAAHRLIVW